MELAVQSHSRDSVLAGKGATPKDALGSEHAKERPKCPTCDCRFEYAAHDPTLIWQSEERDDDCLYYECSCHLFPVFGERIT